MSSPSINEHIESFLSAIAGETGAPDAAETHIETWLAYILSKLGSSGETAGLKGLTKFETLWENASPTSSFASQTISLEDITGYDYIMVQMARTTDSEYATTSISVVGSAFENVYINTSNIMIREYVIYTNSVYFSVGRVYDYSAWTISNSNMIPTKIIGIKVVS